MAAIFQLRRGTSNISITDGELYLHKGSGSIQFGSGSTPYNLLPLNAPVVGDINLVGNITASSAYFSGDVAISGNLFLGNASNDTITAGGEFTSNLIPNPTNTYSLGSSSKRWKEVHATSISGAIAATNGIVSGSSQIVSALPAGIVSGSSQINFTELSAISSNIVSASTDSNNIDFTITNGNISANLKGGVVSGSSQISYVELSNIPAGIISASSDTTNVDMIIVGGTISANLKGGVVSGSSQIVSVLDSLNQFSSSINTATASLNLYTASNDTTNTNQNNRLSRLEESSQSLNDYTSSLKTALSLSGTNVTVLGNLTVNGTTTQINSTQVNIGDNILELNYGGSQTTSGIITKDATGTSTISGSLIWDAANGVDYWKAGKLGNESKILLAGGDSIVSSSAQVVGILESLNSFSASNGNTSLNSYTASNDTTNTTQNNRLSRLEESTASLNAFSASNDNTSLNSYTASNDTTNTTQNNRLSRLEESTASLNTFSASVNGHITDVNAYTSSNNSLNTLQNTRLSRLEESTASLNTFSASINGHVIDINLYTASINGHVIDINSWTGSVNNKFTTLSNVSSSLNQHTQSLNLYTSSTEARLEDLEYTASISIGAGLAGEFSKINQVTASLEAFTSSANIRLNNLETTSQSLNLWSSSLNSTFATDSELNAVSLSVSTSIQILSQSVDARLDNVELFTSSINTTIKSKLDADGVISGSSQVSYLGLSNIPAGIVSGSSQLTSTFVQNSQTSSMTVLAANTVAVASTVTTTDSTLYPTFTNNIVNATVQLKSHPSGTFYFDGITRKVYGEAFVGAIEATNGVVSGSSQVIDILSSLNSFTSSLDATYATEAEVAAGYESKGRGIVSGSSQVSYLGLSNIPAGIVSGSIQVLGGSNILSGSNQSNITSINQNLGTTTTGVQFASLGIGTAPDATYELKIAGDVAASGDIVAYYTSDRRLKNNIQPIDNALDKINELGGYTFDWNEELQKARKGHDIGVVAQEVQSVLPEVVVERDNGYLAVDYEKLVPVLIEAIKELSAKVDRLENK